MASISKINSGHYRVRIYDKTAKKCIGKTFETLEEAQAWGAYAKKNLNYIKALNDKANYKHELKGITSSKRFATMAEELANIDKMSGARFEKYCCELLNNSNLLPYAKYELTKESGDYGADIIITLANQIKIVVQCKRYNKTNKVGLDAIQEVVSSQSFYRAYSSLVMTNSVFTDPAKALAQVNNVALIDRDKLIKLIKIKYNIFESIEKNKQWKMFVDAIDKM